MWVPDYYRLPDNIVPIASTLEAAQDTWALVPTSCVLLDAGFQYCRWSWHACDLVVNPRQCLPRLVLYGVVSVLLDYLVLSECRDS